MRNLLFLLAALLLASPCMAAEQQRDFRDSTWLDKHLIKKVGPAKSEVPIGTIIAWTRHDMPDGGDWLECNGQTVDPKLYPDYVASYGTAVPDYRGVFLRGLGGNSASLGEYQGDAVGKHSHKVESTYSNKGYASAFVMGSMGGSDINSTQSYGQGMAEETRPVNKAVKYLIKVR